MDNKEFEFIEINGRKLRTKILEIGGKNIKVRELFATEYDELDFEKDKKLAIKKQISISANINDTEYNNLTFREKMLIIKAINELNDFQ